MSQIKQKMINNSKLGNKLPFRFDADNTNQLNNGCPESSGFLIDDRMDDFDH